MSTIVVEVALPWSHLAVRDEPEAVGDKRQQMPVMADEDDGAGEVVHCRNQRLARFDVEMVRGLVEDEEGRRLMRDEREGESRLLAARELACACEYVILAEAEAGEMGAHALGRRPRRQPREVVERARLGIEFL